jgi:hypothetical protein
MDPPGFSKKSGFGADLVDPAGRLPGIPWEAGPGIPGIRVRLRVRGQIWVRVRVRVLVRLRVSIWCRVRVRVWVRVPVRGRVRIRVRDRFGFGFGFVWGRFGVDSVGFVSFGIGSVSFGFGSGSGSGSGSNSGSGSVRFRLGSGSVRIRVRGRFGWIGTTVLGGTAVLGRTAVLWGTAVLGRTAVLWGTAVGLGIPSSGGRRLDFLNTVLGGTAVSKPNPVTTPQLLLKEQYSDEKPKTYVAAARAILRVLKQL